MKGDSPLGYLYLKMKTLDMVEDMKNDLVVVNSNHAVDLLVLDRIAFEFVNSKKLEMH